MQIKKSLGFGILLFQVWQMTLSLALSANERVRIVQLHNTLRRQAAMGNSMFTVANMNTLVWSRKLQAQAEKIITCYARRRLYQRLAGNNVNFGKTLRGPNAIEEIVHAWFSQREFYFTAHQNCIPWDKCQELRTMLNARQHSLGCAMLHECGQGRQTVLLCLYEGGPPVQFTFDYKFGEACTKCELPNTFCHNGLCVTCSNPGYHQCDCRKTCNKEGVGLGRLNVSSCVCDCTYGHGPNCDEPCQNPRSFVSGFDTCAALENLDCNLYGHMCPVQCLCDPMPGSSVENSADMDENSSEVLDISDLEEVIIFPPS